MDGRGLGTQPSFYLFARCFCYFHLGLLLADCKCLLPQCLSHENPGSCCHVFTWLETMTSHFAKLQRPTFGLVQLEFLWLTVATQQQKIPTVFEILNFFRWGQQRMPPSGITGYLLWWRILASWQIICEVAPITDPKYQFGLTTFDTCDENPAN